MKFIKVFLLSLFLLLNYLKANSSENINDIKSLLEGRYELVYWTENKTRYDYPEVAGVLVISNDNALITMDKNMNSNKSVELIGWGKYKINSRSFHIGWHDWKLLLIENNIKTVKKKSPWKGMREYNVSLKDNKLVLTSVTGKQSWELDKKSLVYSDKEWGEEKDEVIRYWKRIE
ncbi:hypothetical protein N9V56_04195 [Alphaproteobacteria bacterium]|nr:hypothetical protein [Alphaproteobacteria bacterium]